MKAKLYNTLLVLILGLSGSAIALSPIGPTQAILGQDNWGFGINVGYQNMDLVADGTYFEYQPSNNQQTNARVALEDIESISSFVELSLGLSPDWDIFGCIGAADGQGDAKVENSASTVQTHALSDNEKFDINGKHEMAFGFGTRFTLKDYDTVKWGGMARMTWQKPSGNSSWETVKPTPDDHRISGEWELDYWELILAVGPTFVYDNVQFYCGPFLQMTRGDLNFNGTYSYPGDNGTASTVQDLKEEALIGGYAGMQVDLCRTTLVYVDGQFTGKAWGVGAGAMLRTK